MAPRQACHRAEPHPPPAHPYQPAPLPMPPAWVYVLALVGNIVGVVFGCLRDVLRLSGLATVHASHTPDPRQAAFPALLPSRLSFFKRNGYTRIRDCWGRPATGVPGAHITLVERASDDYNVTFRATGEERTYTNLGSYNYLGFSSASGPCADAAVDAVRRHGVALCSPRAELGTCPLHAELEALVARFLGKGAALTFGAGFATNATTLPVLASPGTLLVSDELNHASIVCGARLSGAAVRIFRHNDMADLEAVLRRAVVEGQPGVAAHRPWAKILICVEGIYSMEGTVADLASIVRLKKRYKAYLYLDEAHSIGAMGRTGRGIAEHLGVDTADVDVMMGTFSKSFGGSGGYIAASKEVIAALRAGSHAHQYAMAMPPPVCQQVTSALREIMGLDGSNEGQRRIERLAANSRRFREALKAAGYIVYGSDASPVVPVLISMPGKLAAFSREMKQRGIAVVVVGFPVVSALDARARFCLSAAHTDEDLDKTLQAMDEVGSLLGLKYNRYYGSRGLARVVRALALRVVGFMFGSRG